MASSNRSSAAGAPVWSVPLPKNANFVGREELLSDLREKLTGRNPADRIQVLTGQGGMGKTQVALEFAHRHRDAYTIVWWIRADDPIAMQTDLVRLGDQLKVVTGESSPDAIIEALKGRLAARADWLLIFDHASAPETLADALPRERTGAVIITSRSSNWPEMRGLAIPPLPREDSIALLKKRSGVAGSVEKIGKVAQALQDVPLALDQGGALIQQAKLTYEQYLALFEKYWADLLQRGRGSGDYPDAVAMAWELSYRQTQQSSPPAAQLLILCAFFASTGINSSFLEDGNLFLDEPLSSLVADPIKLQMMLGTLETFSLVTVSQNKIYVQRIVSQLVRRRLSSPELKKWSTLALRLADFAFKFDPQDVESWTECAAMLPHVRAALDHAIEQGQMLDTATGLLNDIGQLLFRQAKYEDARDCLERAMKIGRKVFREDHSKMRSIANNLGRALSKLDQLEEARRQLEEALEAEEAAHGKDHPQVADLLNNYGACLHKTGDYQKAREIFSRALSIYDLHDLQEEPKAAAIINNLGYVFMKQGNLIGARDLFGRALKIAQRGYGTQHPDVSAILNNIGDLHFLQRDYETARSNYEKALLIDKKVYGSDHPEVARHLGDLGRLFSHTGNPTAGKKYLSQALKIEEATYGRRHSVVANRLSELGRTVQLLGDSTAARAYFERARAILKPKTKSVPGDTGLGMPVDLAAHEPAAQERVAPDAPVPSRTPSQPDSGKIGPGIFSE